MSTAQQEEKSRNDKKFNKRFLYVDKIALAKDLHSEKICFSALAGLVVPPWDEVKNRPYGSDGRTYGECMIEQAEQVIQHFELMAHFKFVGVLEEFNKKQGVF